MANSCWNIYNFRMNLLEKLLELGCEIYTIAPVDEYIRFLTDQPQVHHIDIKELNRKSTNPIKDMLLLRELRSIYRDIRPDICLHFTHTNPIFLVA